MKNLIFSFLFIAGQLNAQPSPSQVCPLDVQLGCNPKVIPPPDLKFKPGPGNCKIISKIFVNDVKVQLGCNWTLTRTYLLITSCGQTIECKQRIHWKEDLVPPIIYCPRDTNLGCNPGPKDILIAPGKPMQAGLVPIAIDNCDGLIPAKFVKDSSVTVDCETTVYRTYEAKDECGNKARCVQKIKYMIDHKTPTITHCPKDLYLGCNPDLGNGYPNPTEFPKFEDNCFVHINWFDNELDVTVTDCIATHIRLWLVTDLCGNQAICQQKIQWKIDGIPPTIKSCGDSKNYGCVRSNPTLPLPEWNNVTFHYNCGQVSRFFSRDTTITMGCMYLVTYRYTILDECGNKANCTREFRWKLISTPIQNVPFPNDLELICQSPNLKTNHIIGTCGVGYPVFHHADTTGNYPSNYSIEVEWRIYDCFGNFIAHTQFIHIVCVFDGELKNNNRNLSNITWSRLNKDHWKVNLEQPASQGTLSVIDMYGRIHSTIDFEKSQTSIDLDISNLDTGVYLFVLQGLNQISTKKIFITK